MNSTTKNKPTPAGATSPAIVTVKRQTELRSKNWGVYRDGRLIEGGFFSHFSADFAANEYRSQIGGAK